MQNLIPKFRQNSIISGKPGYLFEKLKTLTCSNYHRVYIFCRNFAHVSQLTMSKKACWESFLFCLDLDLFIKM